MSNELNHYTKTSFGQCKCLWCGKGRGLPSCPVKSRHRRAVAQFAKQNGRAWKSNLRQAWFDGNYDRFNIDGIEVAYLQQFRNMEHAPLENITKRMIELALTEEV